MQKPQITIWYVKYSGKGGLKWTADNPVNDTLYRQCKLSAGYGSSIPYKLYAAG